MAGRSIKDVVVKFYKLEVRLRICSVVGDKIELRNWSLSHAAIHFIELQQQ